ncbi:hypothetical protein T05_868 [Trichinella murrelli]|uniref:PiggyBac transposable element-derived protein domain-containing protein n=1 Tax=Trichinella murrelli TaxID=144512 RepID=A0A0V0TS22_9BILA|nr:hypothetical protein T05_868 [Trichinella murrelli]
MYVEVISYNVSELAERLVSLWCDKGNNITTKVGLAEELLAGNTNMVGTLRKTESDLSKISHHWRTSNRCILLLSTMPHDRKVCPEEDKPEIVLSYNDTKSATESSMAHGIIIEYAQCRMSGCECETDSQISRVECQTVTS